MIAFGSGYLVAPFLCQLSILGFLLSVVFSHLLADGCQYSVS
jgi:hypothetical protein